MRIFLKLIQILKTIVINLMQLNNLYLILKLLNSNNLAQKLLS